MFEYIPILKALFYRMDILIIEDDVIWQQQLELMLDVLPQVRLDFAVTLEEARSKLIARPPDLVIADVLLTDGISFELFHNLSSSYPIIFITSYASQQFLDQSYQLPDSIFIVKPFHGLSLIAAIKTMMKRQTASVPNTGKHLEVLGKFKQKISLSYDTILYIEADGNYMKIATADRIYSHKSSLKNLTEALDDRFLQIHKSFIVNTTFVKRLDLTVGIVVTQGKALPVGRAYRRQTIEQLTKIIP